MIPISKIKKLPDSPGVYFFKNAGGRILYVGKATSLASRVRSYFGSNILETRGGLIKRMIEEAVKVDYTLTDSVLEALILEASLIKRHQPFFNTREKDDKSYNFVLITEEEFPRVLVVRGREIEKNFSDPKSYRKLYGPFPNGSSLRIAMKIIRRIFPFRDKCSPSKSNHPCFNRQIGLCPGVCSGEITKNDYARIIKHLQMFFDGRKKQLLTTLEREMKSYARKMEFEKATAAKKTVFALKHIQDVALIHRDHDAGSKGSDSQDSDSRIEAYDIAHLAGTATAGVMTVVSGGVPNPAEYRLFKIRGAKGGDDLKALAEVLTRRMKHKEWPMPSLVVIDGGATHLKNAKEVLKNFGNDIPVVSVVKDEKHKPREILGDQAIVKSHKNEILLANSEAHRFALNYHKKLRNRAFLLHFGL